MKRSGLLLAGVLVGSALVACSGAISVIDSNGGAGGGGGQSSGQGGASSSSSGSVASSASSGGMGGGATGLPCDLQMAIANDGCLACHGATPAAGAPMSLVTYADLTAKSTNDPTKTFAERSVIRMTSAPPMPPGAGPTISAADVAVWQAWITAGYPDTGCGGGSSSSSSSSGAPDPLNAAPTCTSGKSSTGNGSKMRPGQACIACHTSQGDGPLFSIAGTVYPTGHEPNDCQSTMLVGATVEITDANGGVHTLNVNSVGNFTSSTQIALPYTAKVTSNGKSRPMLTPQSTGDCNSCHTQSGANNAPGRITAPF